MSQRLLESVLTRSDDGSRFIPIVPLTAEPSTEYVRVDHQFATQRALVTPDLLLLLAAPVRAGELERFTFSEPHMGTRFRIVVYAADRDTASKAAKEAFTRAGDVPAANFAFWSP